MNISKVIIGYTTFPKLDLARSFAKKLITNKLAACAKVIDGIESFYEWEGVVEESKEVYIIFKSTESKAEEVNKLLKANHPYEVYEYLYTYVEGGNKEYLDWVKKQTGININKEGF